jgi:hypothetical protein
MVVGAPVANVGARVDVGALVGASVGVVVGAFVGALVHALHVAGQANCVAVSLQLTSP